MKLMRSLLAVGFASILMCGESEATTTYRWVITNNLSAFGNPAIVYANSTCTDMITCPSIMPTSIPYHTVVTVTATTNGPNPNAEVYIGYSGNTQNECGFAIAGGKAASDGSSTYPNTFAYLLKYSMVGSSIQPGCKRTQVQAVKDNCDQQGLNCRYTGTFSIETYQ